MKFSEISILLLLIAVLHVLFTPAVSYTAFNQSCPSIHSEFNITNYTISFLPEDALYDNYIVQNTVAIISLDAEFTGTMTLDNFSRIGTNLFFRFWCFNETGELVNTEVTPFHSAVISKNDTLTKLKWEGDVRVPYNAKECGVMADAYGDNQKWREESGCGTNGREGTTCWCFVDGLTGRFGYALVSPVWTFQEFVNKKQMDFNDKQLKFNDRQMEFSERQLNLSKWIGMLGIAGTLIAGIVGAVVGGLITIHIENQKREEEQKIRNLGIVL